MKDVRRYRNQPPPVSNRQFLLTSRVDLPSTSSSAAVDNVPDGLTRVSPIQKSSLSESHFNLQMTVIFNYRLFFTIAQRLKIEVQMA